MSFELTSTAFEQGRPIPRQYTGEGQDVSPPLKWTEPPEGTKALALVCEDPDAPHGIWSHWVVFNLPAVSRELSEGVPTEDVLPNGTVQGTNDFHKIGYGGPMPPPGKPHRYFFKLYALDAPLSLNVGCRRAELLKAIEGHVRGEAELMGTYARGQGHELPTDPLDKKLAQDRASITTAPLG